MDNIIFERIWKDSNIIELLQAILKYRKNTKEGSYYVRFYKKAPGLSSA